MKSIEQTAKEFQEYEERAYGKKRREQQKRGQKNYQKSIQVKKLCQNDK